ncbi:MAG: RNA polymerase Rpb4 family protein [Halobacteriaceae archaeon]
MTIFKEIKDEEYLTIAEAKEVLADAEQEHVANDRELRYELTRAIDHVNRFANLEADEAEEFVNQLLEFEKVDEPTAYKIVNLQPKSRDELRAIYAQERFSLSGDELDDILDVVSQYI